MSLHGPFCHTRHLSDGRTVAVTVSEEQGFPELEERRFPPPPSGGPPQRASRPAPPAPLLWAASGLPHKGEAGRLYHGKSVPSRGWSVEVRRLGCGQGWLLPRPRLGLRPAALALCPSLCACLCPHVPLFLGHQSDCVRHTPKTSFYPNYLFKDPLSKTTHILSHIQHKNLGQKDTVPPKTVTQQNTAQPSCRDFPHFLQEALQACSPQESLCKLQRSPLSFSERPLRPAGQEEGDPGT